MVSMLCQNGEQFLVKKLKILYTLDHTILFKFHQYVVQIYTYQIMYGETLDFRCQHQQYGNIKYPIGKSIFAVHLLYIVANADIGSLKFL